MISTKSSQDKGAGSNTPSSRPSTPSSRTHDKEKWNPFHYFSKSPSGGDTSSTNASLASDTHSRSSSPNANFSSNHGVNDSGSTESIQRRKRDKFFSRWKHSERDASTGQQEVAQPSLHETSANGGVPEQSALHVNKKDQAQCASFSDNSVQRLVHETLPEFGSRIDKTPQLALCFGLITHQSRQLSATSDLPLQDPQQRELQRQWMEGLNEPVLQERIRWLGAKVMEEFLKDYPKNSTEIAEISLLGPVLEVEPYRTLLNCTIDKCDRLQLMDVSLLQGLVRLIQDAPRDYLQAHNLVATLDVLRSHLQKLHFQSTAQSHNDHLHLTLAVSRILDVMADHKVQDLDRVNQQETLSDVLSGLKNDSDPFLMYQASYAFQALQYVPNNETTCQAVVRYSTTLADSLIKISALAKLDLETPLEGLKAIQGAVVDVVDIGKSVYEGTRSLMESGKGLLHSVRKSFGSGHKLPWYFAVRSAEALVREGRLADLSSLIQDAECRRDSFFQWGISQLLADIAVGSEWDRDIRQRSYDILDDLFRNDPDWNRDPSVRGWMLALFTMITKTDLVTKEVGSYRLLGGSKNGVDSSQSMTDFLETRLPAPGSTLLARALEIPPVEFKLYCLKNQRLKDRRQVYVEPEAKLTLQPNDKDLFPLMKNVTEFLDSRREVMLILGDSGSGKSTFGLYLEQELWRKYEKGGRIPLFIALPSFDKPQEQMIEKQLNSYDFKEDEVRELRQSRREIILICDGYDESQTGANLHSTNRLNQEAQWRAKMVISCRSQHIIPGYQDWFQPKGQGDRYKRAQTPGLDLFQEAVIVPFSRNQIKDYVEQYVKSTNDDVTSSKPADWTTDDYTDRLESNSGLRDLVSNPFLLSLALVALPGLVKTKEELRSVHVSRVKLYDIFVDRWLTCGKDRLEESKLSETELTVFKEMKDERFIPEAMKYLKGLSNAIFENQAGKPVVTFDEDKNSDVWQRNFFGSNEKIRLLRVSCPLIPSGRNKHRFLHRSLLEYFYSRTFSDPMDPEAETETETESDEDEDDDDPPPLTFAKVRESIADHPLRLRGILNHPSVIQFLAERAQVDIFFKQQLLAMVESVDVDTQSVQAAVQAVEILTMARIRFNGFNLSGARVQGRS